jgi:ribosomal protein L29
MKKNDVKSLKNKDISELKKQLKQAKEELTKTALESKMGKVKNMHIVSKNKKDIAKIMTVINLKKTEEKEKANGAN